MAYLTLDRDKLRHNYRLLDDIFIGASKEWGVVTKLLCGDEEFLTEVLALGVDEVLDSRVSNLRRVKSIAPDARTVYIKPPARGAIEDVVRFADASLNSEVETLRLLDTEARRQGKSHDVIIMIEMGDLREGVTRERLVEVVGKALALESLRVIGIGTNLNCLSGVMPSDDKLVQLALHREIIRLTHGVELPLISAGTSVTIPLLLDGRVPAEVNHFRIGEALFFGRDLVSGGTLDGMHDDVLCLHAEVIEVAEKSARPVGELGENPFGDKASVSDKDTAPRPRVIVDVGYLDADPQYLEPLQPGLEIEGATSDMLVLGVEQGRRPPRVGEVVSFSLRYMGALHAMNSAYIDKRVVTEESEPQLALAAD